MLTDTAVRAALSEVPYPGLKRDIVALGLVRSIAVSNDRVHVSLTLASPRADVPERLRLAIRERLRQAGAVRSEIQILGPERTVPPRPHPAADRARMPGTRHVVAVGAGKGGVGKSAVAVNLALGLRLAGWRVGVLDADIYGPSVPVLLGLEDGRTRIRMTAERQIVPLDALGLAVVSFGFFLGERSPAVWRGPMVGKAVRQFTRGVVWPELDVVVVDLPPGTGDVPLSLSESVAVDGAIVVTTPQRLAAIEAAKAIDMFRKLSVPVLGLVENMSHASCPCGRRFHPFGQGGGDALQQTTGATLLARVPFDDAIVASGDAGTPSMLLHPDTESAVAFRDLASRVRDLLEHGRAVVVGDERLDDQRP